jgi:hypothetical protein
MSYTVTDRLGCMETDPGQRRMREILGTLSEHDPEHPDVALTHESGWALSVFASRLVVFENVEEDARPLHMTDVDPERALALWYSLAEGDIAALAKQPWKEGYG